MQGFADILKKLRKNNNMTQDILAEKLGIKRSTVGMYETGKRRPDIDMIGKIAKVFDVDIDSLLGEKAERDNEKKLNRRDELDIAKKLKDTFELLENANDGLMFDGEPLDERERELLKISLENSLRIGKKIAKEKYTPKKYR